MENQLKQPSMVGRFASAVPIVGPALGLLIEHTEMGVAQYGLLIGLLRGFVIGLVLAVSLIAIGEGILVGFELLRHRIGIVYTAGALEGQLKDGVERVEQDARKKFIHLGKPVVIAADVRGFTVKNTATSVIDGTNVDAMALQSADPLIFERPPQSIGKNIAITPFTRQDQLATLTWPGTTDAFVIVAIDQNVFLIALPEYQASISPVKLENAASSQPSTSPAAPAVAPATTIKDIIHAITISDGVAFVASYATKRGYDENPKSDYELRRLKNMTVWFHQEQNQPEKLPAGTPYSPFRMTVTDPDSLLIVGDVVDPEQKFILVAVTMQGNERFGLIPKAEYDAYRKAFGE